MPAVKRFSVSFAKHPTNGTSASFKYISTSSPPLVLHVNRKLSFLWLSYFFHVVTTMVLQTPGVQLIFVYPYVWTTHFLTLPHILFVTSCLKMVPLTDSACFHGQCVYRQYMWWSPDVCIVYIHIIIDVKDVDWNHLLNAPPKKAPILNPFPVLLIVLSVLLQSDCLLRLL